MKIETIALTNFRSYRETQKFEGLSNVNSFIGPNGAGKSNVFEAMKLLKGLLGGNWKKPFAEMVFDRNVDLQIEISLKINLSDQERDKILTFLLEKNKWVKFDLDRLKKTSFLRSIDCSFILKENGIKAENVQTTNISTGEYVLLRKSREGGKGNAIEEKIDLDACFQKLNTLENLEGALSKSDIGTPTSSILNYSQVSPSMKMVLDNLRGFIESWAWLEPNRSINSLMDSGEELQLAANGNNMVRFMNCTSSSSPRKFVSLTDKIIKILPDVEEILAPLRERKVTMTFREKGLKNATEVNNVSYGYMQIPVLTVGIITGKSNSLVMIEEPELNLHASAQRRLFALIQELTGNKQFFLTTHSTIFTGCDSENTTYLITKKEGVTNVTRIETPEKLRIAKDALGHRNMDLFGDECVVFIEGDSERIAFPIIAGSLKFDLCRKGIRLINVEGSGKFKKMKEYLEYLRGSGVISYVIADGNKEVKGKLEDWQRAGIIQQNNWTVWELEFEDCFDYGLVAQAMNEEIKEQGGKLEITAKQLQEEKKEGVSVVLTLKRLLFNEGLEFDKPALAEKLALLLSEEIAEEGHQPTRPEKEIRKMVELVDRRYSEMP